MRFNEIIRKVKGGYRLYSHSGKNLGTYDTQAGAKKRERQVQYFKHAKEDQHPNEKPAGPEIKPTMPAGTVRVDVSDVYDWYKLGKVISDLRNADKSQFHKGPPSTILAFGSEEQEHKYIKALKKVGLDVTDIDPGYHGIKTDPTYNVENSNNRSFIKNESELVIKKNDFPKMISQLITVPQKGIGKKEFDPRLLAKIYQVLTGEPVEYDTARGTYVVHKSNIKEAYQGGLRKWFKQKWVNIGKKKKSGGHPECGTSGDKKGYAKCVPASKAASMTDQQKKSAVTRKRSAQNKAGRGGKSQPGQGNKPIRVSTKPKK